MPHVEAEAGIALAAAGEDEHDRPLAASKDAGEGLFIRAAGLGRVAGMSVEPDSAELLGFSAGIHLRLEKIRHRLIIERHAGDGYVLLDGYELFDPQQVSRRRYGQPADFCSLAVAEVQQLGPRRG